MNNRWPSLNVSVTCPLRAETSSVKMASKCSVVRLALEHDVSPVQRRASRRTTSCANRPQLAIRVRQYAFNLRLQDTRQAARTPSRSSSGATSVTPPLRKTYASLLRDRSCVPRGPRSLAHADRSRRGRRWGVQHVDHAFRFHDMEVVHRLAIGTDCLGTYAGAAGLHVLVASIPE